MQRTILIMAVVAIGAILAAGAARPARADMECPDGMEATIESLHHCVEHAVTEGHIDNAGVAQSLLAKLSAAQAAAARGNTAAAVGILNAFILEVEAQAGRHIDSEHAEHMIEHAEMVIEALGG